MQRTCELSFYSRKIWTVGDNMRSERSSARRVLSRWRLRNRVFPQASLSGHILCFCLWFDWEVYWAQCILKSRCRAEWWMSTLVTYDRSSKEGSENRWKNSASFVDVHGTVKTWTEKKSKKMKKILPR